MLLGEEGGWGDIVGHVLIIPSTNNTSFFRGTLRDLISIKPSAYASWFRVRRKWWNLCNPGRLSLNVEVSPMQIDPNQPQTPRTLVGRRRAEEGRAVILRGYLLEMGTAWDYLRLYSKPRFFWPRPPGIFLSHDPCHPRVLSGVVKVILSFL
jgi:hypothetical protein